LNFLPWHPDWIVYLAAFQRALHLLRSEGTRFWYFEFPLARTAGGDPNLGIFECDLANFFSSTVAGLVSAAFAYLGTGLHPIWWALWLAPIPVLAIAPGLRGSTAFLLAAFAWLIGEMNQWNYVRHAIELPPQITILYFVVPAVVFGLGILFVRSLLRRGSLFLASLPLPVYWVTYEYLMAITSPHSTWGNLAYTQMNCLPVIQIAAITGPWGISFIVFLFAAAVAALLSGAGGPWQRRAVAVAVGIVVCAVFVFGKWRLQSNPPAQSVAVTLIAKDVPMSVYLGSEERALTC
jgi:apolipoprotein N-acyltransferase